MSYIKTARFGSGAVIARASEGRPLTDDELQRLCPAIFAEEPHESRSERYAYIPTSDVLAGLRREGFEPFEVRQGGSRDADKRAFTKHMLRLRHVGAGGALISGDNVSPEVILLNSHDGTSSYQLTAGLFRMVCTNGLIAGDAFEHVRVPHKGDVVGQVIDAAFKVIDEFPRVVDGAREMAGVSLSQGEQLAFANAALQLRWTPEDEQQAARAPIEASALLAPRRSADTASDLWRTFNRVQEHVIRGGQRVVTRNARGQVTRRSTVRPVNGIDQNRALNRALWTLADEMQRLKAA